MPQILAGVLSMADIALHAITQGEVYLASSGGGNWSPAVWVDLPVTITVNVPQGAKALCLFQSSMRAPYAGKRFALRCVIDGVPYPESTMTSESDQTGRYAPSACFAFVSGLAAGSHTFGVQATCYNSASASYWENLRHVVAILKR